MAYEEITKYNSPNRTLAANVPYVYGRERTVDHITIHWWGEPAHRPTFEGVVAYLCDGNRPGPTSAHAVIEDGRCAWIVDGWDAAWHAGSAVGNATGIGLELNPRCSEGDYDTAAEVIADLWLTYKTILPLRPHNHWQSTECPGNGSGRGYNLDKLYRLAVEHYNRKRGGAAAKPAPKPVAKPAPAPAKKPVSKAPVNGVHVVQKGESLSGIAAKYGTTTQSLQKLNSFIKNPNFLNVGDRVRVSAPKPASTKVGTVHVVKKGESLSGIAAKYGTTTQNLQKLNSFIKNPNFLNVGDRVRVK